MKIKHSFLFTAILGVALTGCSPDEPTAPADNSKAEYESNWGELIGDIDPDQTWNVATQRTVTVNTSSDAEVSIYTRSTTGSYLVARTTVNGTKAITFDAPAAVKEVYVVKNSESGRDVQTVDVTSNPTVTFLDTRAAEGESDVVLYPREKIYAKGFEPVQNEWDLPFHGYTDWGCTFYATSDWRQGLTAGVEYTLPEAYQDIKEVCSNMYIADDNNITKLYPYTQNYKITTTEAGEISLIGMYNNTSANCAIAYYYTGLNASLDEMKAADKYVIIPSNTADKVLDRKFTLVYYDPANNYEPTTTFPAGVEIYFGLVRSVWGLPNPEVEEIKEEDVVIGTRLKMDATLCLFSNIELNREICAYQNWTAMSGSALYSTHGVNVLSFEDWGSQFSIDSNGSPYNGGDVDWNDVAFIIDGKIEDLTTIDEVQPWILACEDLGNTDDFDFNDVVFSIERVVGETTATITPLAAGGELSSSIYYNGRNLGEIHDLLGGQRGTMINTTTKGKPGEKFTITVPEDFTMAATNMGGFTIVVDGNNGQATIAAPEAGAAPQMICVDGTSWLWPTERTSIVTAYPAFATWCSDHTQALDWYTTPVEGSVVK